MKTCTGCKAEKPLDQFYQQGLRTRSRCKECYSAHNAAMRVKHADKRAAYDKERGTGWDRTGRALYALTSNEKHDSYLTRTYGITLADYERMHAAQGGVCAICRQECNRSTTERLNVDHHHGTGHVRGLLCFKCNVGLGRFNDDIETLLRAVHYLREAEAARNKSAVFISGPMSNIAEFNYPAFNREAKRLRALGYRAANPAENPTPKCGTWTGFMRLSIAQLVTCDVVAMLPGWEKSRGATLERAIGIGLGLLVVDAAALTGGPEFIEVTA